MAWMASEERIGDQDVEPERRSVQPVQQRVSRLHPTTLRFMFIVDSIVVVVIIVFIVRNE